MILPLGAEIIRRIRRSGFTPRAVPEHVMILPLGAEIISSDQAKAIHSPSRNKAADDFAAWGRNHSSDQAKRIHSASRTRARDDFAAWGRNYLVGSGEGDSLAEPYQST